MKKTLLLGFMSVLFGLIYLAFNTNQLYAMPPFEEPPKGGLPVCMEDLNLCNSDLDTCEDNLAECEAKPGQTFPGDGYDNPDAFGLSGHGPALSYMDNGNGTFTDENTGLMWEIKDDTGGIHDNDNTCTWSTTFPNDDGTLFTEFLYALNSTCNGTGVDDCRSDDDCMGVGNGVCGFAGYQN